jgi:hypothetical protein
MVSLPVVVRRELVERPDQAPFAEQDQPVQTLLANRPDEPLRVGIGVRRLVRRQDYAYSGPFKKPSESIRPLAVPVADQYSITRQEPVNCICEAPRRLDHEDRIGIRRRTHYLHPPALEIQHEQRVVGPQPAGSPHFPREEVGRGNRAPVRPQRGAPRRGPFWCRRDPVVLQHPGHHTSRDPVIKVPQCPLGPTVAPARIIRGHPDDEGGYLFHDPGTPRAP